MASLVDGLYGLVWRRVVSSRLSLSSSWRRRALPWRFWVQLACAVEGFPVGSRGPLRCRSALWALRTGHPSLLALPVRVPESLPLRPLGGRLYSLTAGTCDRLESGTTSAISPSGSPSRRTAGARRAATKAGATASLARLCGGSTERAPSRTRA